MSASKRDQLVQNALRIFYRDGFHATGMDKLVAETGVSKRSIYNHFRTKEDLIQATLRLRDEQFRNWLTRRIETLADLPGDCLLVMFDALGEWFEENDFQSCMFVKASSEYQDRDHPIHATSAEHKRLLLAYIRDLAEKAGAEHPDVLARQLLLLKEGAIVTAHLQGPSGIAKNARSAANLLVDNAITARKAAKHPPK